VVDYHQPETAIEEIKSASGGGVVGALETIGGMDNLKFSIGTFGPKGGLCTCLLNVPEEAKNLRSEVKPERILMYTVGGYTFNFNPAPVQAVPEDHEWYIELAKLTSTMITEYGLKPNPVDLREGLESILPALEELQAGKISGKKLTYKIA